MQNIKNVNHKRNVCISYNCDPKTNITDEEMFYVAYKKVLKKYRKAFEKLAK